MTPKHVDISKGRNRRKSGYRGNPGNCYRFEKDNRYYPVLIYKVPRGITINPLIKEEYTRVSVKGAIYSSAFILQEIVATMLDIDPEELAICRVQPRFIDGNTDSQKAVAEVVITDKLPNGSGTCKWIFDNWKEKILPSILNAKETDGVIYWTHSI